MKAIDNLIEVSMAGCECDTFQRNLGIDNLRYEDGVWKRAMVRLPGRNEILYKPIDDNRCPWCGSKLTEEAGDEG